MKIAIVGAGISGLTAAFLLHRHHDITVYEAAKYIGGHTATKAVEVDGRPFNIDTGFIVYNEKTYPNFIRLMDTLAVKTKPTDMGFSVTTRHQSNIDFEYCGSTLNSLFADRRRLLDPSFIGMVRDILRFGKRARKDLLQNRIDPALTLDRYLQQGKYGAQFLKYYIIPMASAIWSASTTRVQQFNALFFIRFFHNHGLLNVVDRPQWRVIRGGSNQYVEPLTRNFKDTISLANPVQRVERKAQQIHITSRLHNAEYDQVIFACHSDQVLDILVQPSVEEQALLQAIPYKVNSVVMHTDPSLLPKRRRAWASWNYLLDGNESEQPVLTYNMNILQGIQSENPICVTMNGDQYIDPEKIIGKYRYSHPQFASDSVEVQKRIQEINGSNSTWYCGACWRNGFHEDGVWSALQVAEGLNGDSL